MVLKFQFISESLYVRLQRKQQKRLDGILFHEKLKKYTHDGGVHVNLL